MIRKVCMGLAALMLALAVSVAGGAEAVLEIAGDNTLSLVEVVPAAVEPEQVVPALPQPPAAQVIEPIPDTLTLVNSTSDVITPSLSEDTTGMLEVRLYDWFGEELQTYRVMSGELIEAPTETPELRGARFIFWFDASVEDVTEFDFTAPIFRDTELYPLFIFEDSIPGSEERAEDIPPEQLMEERAETLMNDIMGLMGEKAAEAEESSREHPDIKPAEDLIGTIFEVENDASAVAISAPAEDTTDDQDASYAVLTVAQQNSLSMGILGIVPDGEELTPEAGQDGETENLDIQAILEHTADIEEIDLLSTPQEGKDDTEIVLDPVETDEPALETAEEETALPETEAEDMPPTAPQGMYVVVEPDRNISEVLPGDVVTLRAHVANLPEGYTAQFQWQSNESGAYTDIPGATAAEYSFIVGEGSENILWKVEVSVSNEL